MKNIFDRIQMTNMMIIFQILGQYDQMGSHGMDVSANTERLLHTIQWHLVRLTHRVLMEVVEDLPIGMQRHVVGMP